jgi:PEP-CTERM motif
MNTSCLSSAALALGLAALPAQAQSFSLNATVSGTSVVTEVINATGPVLRFVTQTTGSGSFTGLGLAITGYTSTDVVNLGTGIGSGTNVFIADNGDQLFGSFTVEAAPSGTPGGLNLQGLTTFSGGTGVFAGATGSGAFSGSGNFVSQTEALVTFTHVGNVAVVPEPASGALIAGGLAAVAAATRRRRRTD